MYEITASLDPAGNSIKGTVEITYTNNSASPLELLAIHLWPNAYASKNSAFAKQLVRHGKSTFERVSLPDAGGGLSGLDFRSSGQQVKLLLDTEHSDIGWLHLNEPLLPGDSIHLFTPYLLKVPESFSRLGVTGDAFQITQWYPHLAVLDEEGWHTMPYLDQGEFFNDFADYVVSIRVPDDYIVAATGSLLFTRNESGYQEWKFEALNVIDFAWFSSPGFRHQKFITDNGEGKEIEINIYTDTPGEELWEQAGAYAKRAIKFYSDWLGPYPYPQMSVVHTPLSRAGYMEYPMVAQIGGTSDTTFLDMVIAHEIGHTWLYAILANNERKYPWLDEGMNSFLERRYMDEFHIGYEESYLPKIVLQPGSMSSVDAFQHYVRFNGDLDPPASDPVFQKADQYFFSAYLLPAQGLEILASMKGMEMMKKMFRQYFSDHQFSHVTPEDLKHSFEVACACRLDWFFSEWLHHAHQVDYRIKVFNRKDKEVTVKNHGTAVVPLHLTSYKDGRQVLDHWLDGFSGQKIIHLDAKADEVRLYEKEMAINKKWSASTKPTSLLPQLRIFPKIDSYAKRTLSITPFLGINVTDGLMPGVAFTSGLLPQQNFKFVVAPMYGIDSREIRGHAEGRYISDFTSGYFDKLLLSLSFDRFGYHRDTHYLFRDHFERWSPIVALRVDRKDVQSPYTQWWKYRYVQLNQYYGRGVNFDAHLFEQEKRTYNIHELSYQLHSSTVLKPFTASANVQAGEGFVRLNVHYKQHFIGKDKMRGLWIRGYGGWLPIYDKPKANVLFTINGSASNGFFSRDYMFDEWLGGRNAVDGVFSRQVFTKDAGLKTLSTIGIGDKWMVGGGISVSMPFRVVHFYMDAALYPSGITEKNQLSFSGGLAIILMKNVFEIYVPFLESKDIRESLSYEVRDRWFERVSFQANFKLVNPLNLVDHFQLGY